MKRVKKLLTGSKTYSTDLRTKAKRGLKEKILNPQKPIKLGNDKDGHGPIFIDSDTRKTHMQIVGSTGTGKSKLIEHLIRKDIKDNNGLCLIDPHGHLYHDILRWCEYRGMLDRNKKKKILLFDPSDDNYTFGFNPLETDSPDISFHVDAMVKAVGKVWGDEDQSKTPTLDRCLTDLFQVLAEKKLSLLESEFLINATDETVRTYLTKNIKDSTVMEDWEYFNSLKPKPFRDEFLSTINRMVKFLRSPIIRSIIGQITHTINFRKIMDEGWVLLVNLATADKISEQNAQLLGSLIVNDLFMKAKGRPESSRPFYLYIDECALYINEDIARMLDEARKFGLHLILAHQHLDQLRDASMKIYNSIMTDAKTKVIFGGLSAEDAEVLAKQVFLGEINLEEYKEKITKPMVTGYIKTFVDNYSSSKGKSRGESSGYSSGQSESESDSDAETAIPDPAFLDDGVITTTKSAGSGRGRSSSESHTSSYTESESEAHGRAETYIGEIEERQDTLYSLQEQIHRKMALMVNQEPRHAIIKKPNKKSQMLKVEKVEKPPIDDDRIQEFKEKCYKLDGSDYVNPKLQIESEINNRLLELKEEAINDQEPEEPTSFRG